MKCCNCFPCSKTPVKRINIPAVPVTPSTFDSRRTVSSVVPVSIWTPLHLVPYVDSYAIDSDTEELVMTEFKTPSIFTAPYMVDDRAVHMPGLADDPPKFGRSA